VEPGLNGLVDGVGLEVLGVRAATVGFSRPGLPAVVKREGRVPARVLPRNWLGALPGESGWAAKSGKLSPWGDSGIESRRGVELPLVGGPQIWGVMPSWAWISRALIFELAVETWTGLVAYRFG
jgi:hypothetical protein